MNVWRWFRNRKSEEYKSTRLASLNQACSPAIARINRRYLRLGFPQYMADFRGCILNRLYKDIRSISVKIINSRQRYLQNRYRFRFLRKLRFGYRQRSPGRVV
jgi:hypothetical protein